MDKSLSITRRAAILGALVSTAALPVPVTAKMLHAREEDEAHVIKQILEHWAQLTESEKQAILRSHLLLEDAELVALGHALDASIAAETIAYRGAWEDGGERAYEASRVLVNQIDPLPVSTLAGLQVKAKAALWCIKGVPMDNGESDWSVESDSILDESETTDYRLLGQIVSALVAMT